MQTSSMISNIYYNETAKELTVDFQKGGRYIYSNVSKEVFEGLDNSESVGKYFLQNIKGNYSFRK